MGQKLEILVSERDFDFSMVEVTRTNMKTDLPKFESRGFKKVNVSFPLFQIYDRTHQGRGCGVF